MSHKTILATCYAVNPYKGSEDGMGWNYVNQIARFNRVIAITRENNRAAIEQYLKENPDPIHSNITFMYFDLPYWMRFWKKGGRGALLYYWMWQKGIVSFVKRQNITFDITHNLNFHNDWTPTYLYQLNKPMVWGPIGHHPKIPFAYLRSYSRSFWLKDRLTWLVKKAFWSFSWALKRSVKHAHHILCMNDSVQQVLNLKGKSISIYPSVATEDYNGGTLSEKSNFSILSIGRFVPLKGFDLTIQAFILFIEKLSEDQKKSCHLTLVGSGPMESYFKALIQQHQMEAYITIIPWMERKEVMELYRQSSVFLFPSHEGAGMVVPEALSFGLPVICLDNVGPGQFITPESGIVIPQGTYEATQQGLAKGLLSLFDDRVALNRLSLGARKQFESKFTWDQRGNQLRQIYDQVVCAS